jgi:ribonuclease R
MSEPVENQTPQKINQQKKEKKSKKVNTPKLELQTAVLAFFEKHSTKKYNARQVIELLGVKDSRSSMERSLRMLVSEGKLAANGQLTYWLASKGETVAHPKPKIQAEPKPKAPKANLLEGKVDMLRSGSAYAICEGRESDIYIPHKFLGSALHGDCVKVALRSRSNGGGRAEGEIVDVTERATEHFIGILQIRNKRAFVLPDRQNMPVDIFVNPDQLLGGKDGEKVVVKIVRWHNEFMKSPIGKVTSVLGAAGSSDIEMKSILINHGFDLDFSEETMKEADELNDTLSLPEIKRRRDFRKITTFTIDPEDAKDFDDALSYDALEDGTVEIGVHIADVTHYVKPATALDKEAYLRSTSVYLVDRVLPMLPEKISNELCSLRPHEDKCTFSAVFTFDADDNIIKRWFGKTLIHSNHRFSYESAQEVLDNKKGIFFHELTAMNRIALKLRKERFKNGAINFETDEVRFRLDEKGVPLSVYIKERKATNLLIEDFMLLANREVGTFIQQKQEKQAEIPYIYRIHDTPNMEKLIELSRFAAELGFSFRIDSPKHIAKSINDLAKVAVTNPTLKLLEPLAIRTMSKAVYSSNNIGHYGLGFDNYSHFTSPIRRYSDVLAHRLLFNNLGDKTYRDDKEILERQCKHISTQERHAMEAERESTKYKQVEFLKKHIGEEFDGVISGMMERGVFIELKETKCEGMVSFQSMSDRFELEPSRLKAKGEFSGDVIKMGDAVRVRILSADLAKRQIEMEFVRVAPVKKAPPKMTREMIMAEDEDYLVKRKAKKVQQVKENPVKIIELKVEEPIVIAQPEPVVIAEPAIVTIKKTRAKVVKIAAPTPEIAPTEVVKIKKTRVKAVKAAAPAPEITPTEVVKVRKTRAKAIKIEASIPEIVPTEAVKVKKPRAKKIDK